MLNIVDWLNDNCRDSLDYNKWLDSIDVKRIHLENIFTCDLIQGFMYIVQESLPLHENNLSVRCFDQKKGIFFIYTDKDKWRTMTGLEFEKMINVINMKICKEFKIWQTENKEKILKHNITDNSYQECVIKILGGNLNQGIVYSRIKGKLYNYLKFNLKKIIEFEFN